MSNFDWTEDQKLLPEAIVNPGVGPIHNTSHALACANIVQLIEDVYVLRCQIGDRSQKFSVITYASTDQEYNGRYRFDLTAGDRTVDVDMPGLALDEVRFLGREDQNVWDFPRLYVEGNSWVWRFAIDMVVYALYPKEQS